MTSPALYMQDSTGGLVVMEAKAAPLKVGDEIEVSGKPEPHDFSLALREAKVLARNIHGVLNGQPPRPFVYNTLGMMGSLGHSRAFGQLLNLRVHGVLAWLVRRTYYLLQMPG